MSIADRKKREKEKRREDILNAAEKLFFSGEYDSITMNSIAEEAEVNKALLYYYFKDKQSLFLSVVTRGSRILLRMVKESETREVLGLEKISAIGKAYYQFAHDYPDYYRIGLFFRTRGFDITAITDSECLTEYKKIGNEIASLSISSIELGIQDGTIRSDLDPVEIYVVLSWIADNIPTMRPAFTEKLEIRGVTKEKFVQDVWNLQRRMIMNIRMNDNN
ncbi:TetR/AcrR family transcriptional regulator [Methanospirillum stamsii]|uniref:TetR/AcrR family transcriptional regulator n=1 Tax=Methanospirillum stamsii TaxID=1277351 RepID=UPI0015E832BF|nr:TetR/AcrR family transcriptional regulator [Methanospirillum stamsii]